MTSLFTRLQPARKFRISIKAISQLLNIPKQLIVRVECWKYVVFVHRRDRGGQFISYRKLQQWFNATACQIQKCTTWQQLRQLWLAIEADYKKYNKQYQEQSYEFLSKIWTKHWRLLWSEPESTAEFG
ncbi:MAG: hypothetical protein F6K36_25665 [Symploca sp. SIO3C6]|nr:hypothetical protein [Symploca sp. SIO3C6]